MLGDVSAPLFLGLTEDSLIVRFLGSWFFMCHVVLSFLSSPRSTPTWTPLFFISLPRKRKEMSILLPFSCLYCPLIPHIKAVFSSSQTQRQTLVLSPRYSWKPHLLRRDLFVYLLLLLFWLFIIFTFLNHFYTCNWLSWCHWILAWSFYQPHQASWYHSRCNGSNLHHIRRGSDILLTCMSTPGCKSTVFASNSHCVSLPPSCFIVFLPLPFNTDTPPPPFL